MGEKTDNLNIPLRTNDQPRGARDVFNAAMMIIDAALVSLVASNIGNDSAVSGSTVKDALNALKSGKLDASAYTAADVLAKLLTVDGSGSGVDADLLDGNHASAFVLAATYTAADVLSKIKTVDGAGSGLDADLLDGINSSAFAQISSGIWTPTLMFGGASTGITYNVHDGSWLRSGNIGVLWGHIYLANKGSASGVAQIGALPFSVNGFAGQGMFNGYSNLSGIATNPFLCGQTTYLEVRSGGAASTSFPTQANFTNTSEFFFAYVTAL